MNEETKVITEETQSAETAAPDQSEELLLGTVVKTHEIEESTSSAEDTATESDASAKEETTTTGAEESTEETKEETTEMTEQPSGWDGVLSHGLPIMAAGMMGIFVVIGIIIASVSLLAKLGDGNGYFSKGVKALFSKNK